MERLNGEAEASTARAEAKGDGWTRDKDAVVAALERRRAAAAAAAGGAGAQRDPGGEWRGSRCAAAVRSNLGLVFVALAVAALLGGVTATVYVVARDTEAEAARDAFAQFAKGAAYDVQERLKWIENLIVDTASFVGLSEGVTREEFARFADAAAKVHDHEDDREWAALEWAPLVPAAERAAFEARMAAELAAFAPSVAPRPVHNGSGADGFAKVPSKPYVVPIAYAWPTQGNEAALLFDLTSDAVRSASIEHAWRTGETTCSSRVVALQEVEHSFASLMLAPVFRARADGEDEFAGVVVVVVRYDHMMAAALGAYSNGAYPHVYHGHERLPHAFFSLMELSTPGRRDGDSSPLVLSTVSMDHPSEGVERVEHAELLTADGVDSLLQGSHDRIATDFNFVELGCEFRLTVISEQSDFLHIPRPSTVVLITTLVSSLAVIGLLAAVALYYSARARMQETHVSRLSAEADRLDVERAYLERFVSMTSHDLRTPLTTIALSSELLETHIPPDGPEITRELVNNIVSSTRSLDKIVVNTLDMANISNGKLDIEAELQMDFADQLRALSTSVSESGRRHVGVAVETVFHPTNLQPMSFDGKKMLRVVLNLLTNAVKFTTAGRVVLTAAIVASPEELLFVSVADTGVGMSPERTACAGESPFSRCATSEGGGTGLGLYIARSFIEAAGGAWTVTSAPGVGTTISFVVPVSLQTMPPASAQPSSLSLPSDGAAPPVKVLLVDDSVLLLKVTTRMLRSFGSHVTVMTAEDGQQALDVLTGPEGKDVDVCFMDRDMPNLDGHEAVRRFRSWECQHRDERVGGLHIVMMTGNVAEVDRLAALECGADDFAPKPVSSAALRKFVAASRSPSGCA